MFRRSCEASEAEDWSARRAQDRKAEHVWGDMSNERAVCNRSVGAHSMLGFGLACSGRISDRACRVGLMQREKELVCDQRNADRQVSVSQGLHNIFNRLIP